MRLRLSLIVGLALMASVTFAEEQAVQMTVSLSERLGPMHIERMALGQGGLSQEPMWDNRIAEIRVLRPAAIRLFIQEYFDLLPTPGRYHFDTLDRSVDTILATGAEPIMCICFKPKGLFPVVDQNIVEPNDYAQWEELIFRMVRHSKERDPRIRYWEVANEPDIGESGGCPYRFQPENYTRYYKHTVDAILRADPNALVGGPALAWARSPILPRLVEFCEKENVPLHFVSWHIYSSDPLQIRGTIDYVRDLLAKHPGVKPQMILDEWNVDLSFPPEDPRFQPCYVAEVIWQMKEGGLDYSCYYHIRDWHVQREPFAKFMSPQGTMFMFRWWNRRPQYDGLFDYQNEIRPAYFTFKLLSRLTGERLRVTSASESVHGLATWDSYLELYNLLVWNYSTSPARVRLTLADAPGDLTARPLVLDAMTANNDENARLRSERPVDLTPEKATLDTSLEPYGVRFWSIERR
jgi:hypothetical protein